MRILYIVIMAGVITACTKEKAAPVGNSPSGVCADISFSNEIMPQIIDASCTQCHNSSSASGGYDLSSYALVSQHADVALQTIKHQSGVSPMPFGGSQLNDSLITKFECWISNGKPNN